MKSFFRQTKLFLDIHVAPVSDVLDHDENLLKNIYGQLIKLGALKFLISKEFGGLGGERSEWVEYNILMAQYSGALLFLQAQHQFAVSQLKKLLPEKRVMDLLRMISQDNLGLGIALAANRQLLNVVKAKNGFQSSGKLLWVTGFNYFQSVLFSFDIDNQIYYSILPFNSILKNKSIDISKRIETTVFNSTNTVCIALDNYFISNNEIIAIQPLQPKTPTEHPAVYNFAGAAKVLLELASQGKYKNCNLSKEKYASLLNEWEIYYKKILKHESCPLKLRTQGLSLAEKCISFARMVCGAESILASHPINRISREIWQYSVAGYSEDQLNAYLAG
jgi:hypothetical protein